MVKNGNLTLLLTSSGLGMAIYTLLLTTSGQEWQLHIAMTMSRGVEWQFHMLLLTFHWSRMAISHCC